MNIFESENLKTFIRWAKDDLEKSYKAEVNIGWLTIACTIIDAAACFRYGITKDNPEKIGKRFERFVLKYMKKISEESKYPSGKLRKRKVVFKREYNYRISASRPKPRKVEYKKLSYPQILYKHFRCGLIHERMPKFGTAVDRIENETKVVLSQDYYGKNDSQEFDMIINLPPFKKDLLIAIEKFYQDIRNKPSIEKNYIKRIRFLTRK